MPRMLIVDNDPMQARVLTRALRSRRFEVVSVRGRAAAINAAKIVQPDFVVLEQHLDGDSGLALIRPLKALNPDVAVLVLTAGASIPAAVDAIKLGACNYLAKPAYAEEILAGFGLDLATADENACAHKERTHTLDELEWKHILRALNDCEGNIAAAARALKMHRKTLQRKLAQQQLKSGKDVVAEIRQRQQRQRRYQLRAASGGFLRAGF